jgi:hypothetical protein
LLLWAGSTYALSPFLSRKIEKEYFWAICTVLSRFFDAVSYEMVLDVHGKAIPINQMKWCAQ